EGARLTTPFVIDPKNTSIQEVVARYPVSWVDHAKNFGSSLNPRWAAALAPFFLFFKAGLGTWITLAVLVTAMAVVSLWRYRAKSRQRPAAAPNEGATSGQAMTEIGKPLPAFEDAIHVYENSSLLSRQDLDKLEMLLQKLPPKGQVSRESAIYRELNSSYQSS